MPRAIPVDKESPFRGETCALCKEPFAPGDDLVVCNECGTRHHSFCWQEAGNHCTALGCTGRGEVIRPNRLNRPPAPAAATASQSATAVDTPITPIEAPRPATPPARRRLRPPRRGRANGRNATAAAPVAQSTVPENAPWHLRWAQSCLVLSIAIAILLFAFGCFGLWAMADYLFIEVFEWPYRAIPQSVLPLFDRMWTVVFVTLL